MGRLILGATDNAAFKRVTRPHEVRVKHQARHARTSDLRPRRRTSLSIRSAERRRWAADLTGPGAAALVIYGMGGIGKSTLAAQIVARVSRLQSDRVIRTISGEVSAASFPADPAEADVIICDNFDDNLTRRDGQWHVRDPDLAAMLATWTGKLLITSRRPFTLSAPEAAQAAPGQPGQPGPGRLVFRRLGPLTRSGAAELTTSLPAIRMLDDTDRDQIWRITAGHPLAMEYLDLLLAQGERYPEVAGRIEAAIQALIGHPLPGTEPTELPEATAEMIARAAGDQMFGELYDRLSAGARTLLVRASVFRRPVAAEALAARPGHIAECEAAGLLSIEAAHELTVHRWTADELHRRLAEADLAAQVAGAHRQAAGFWLARAGTSERADVEAGYHQERASELARGPEPVVARDPAAVRRRRLVRYSVAGAFAAMSVVLAVEASQARSVPNVTTAEAPAASAQVAAASAVRDRAAGWVAREVSAGAIVACDPAMCALLERYGVAAGNLITLGPGAADPLGSDVVLATAAVRAVFGSRLATVYAPDVLASFGTGAARIDVRAVAPDGTAAYRTALAADLRARQQAGAQLLGDPRITATPSARAELSAGQVDARLLITLAALAADQPVHVTGFGDRDPGASPGLPVRVAELTGPAAVMRKLLAFVRAQHSPYLPSRAVLAAGPGGEPMLTIEFAAPDPLGLLQTQPQ